RMFWIILMVAATFSAVSPKKAPAATTAPVESMVPPIQAPPSTSGMSTATMKAGSATIMMDVKTMDRPTAVVSSSLVALQAAAVAMAADTPHTHMSALTVMLSDFEEMR